MNESAYQESNSELREFKAIEKIVSDENENTEDKTTKMQAFDQSSMERSYQHFLEVHSTANPSKDSKHETDFKNIDSQSSM